MTTNAMAMVDSHAAFVELAIVVVMVVVWLVSDKIEDVQFM